MTSKFEILPIAQPTLFRFRLFRRTSITFINCIKEFTYMFAYIAIILHLLQVLTECLFELLPEIDICYPTLAMLRRIYQENYIEFHFTIASFSGIIVARFHFSSVHQIPHVIFYEHRFYLYLPCVKVVFFSMSRSLINLHGYFDSQSFCTQPNLKILHHEHLSYI